MCWSQDSTTTVIGRRLNCHAQHHLKGIMFLLKLGHILTQFHVESFLFPRMVDWTSQFGCRCSTSHIFILSWILLTFVLLLRVCEMPTQKSLISLYCFGKWPAIGPKLQFNQVSVVCRWPFLYFRWMLDYLFPTTSKNMQQSETLNFWLISFIFGTVVNWIAQHKFVFVLVPFFVQETKTTCCLQK